MDEKISLLIFGGSLLKEIDNDNSSNQGLVRLLLTIVKLIRQIPFMCHFSRDFSKDDLVDFNLNKLCKMTLEQRNKFLIEELKYLMSEMNCSDKYIMDLFVSDIMRVDYVVEKVWYRKRRNFLLIYRGLLFLLERRFETFLNVTLFREVLQIIGMYNPSEAMVVCLIRAGMVFAITDIWKTFIEERDLSGSIALSMREAKQKISPKKRYTKGKNGKAAVAKTKESKAKKALGVVTITAAGKSKRSKVSFKSETTNKMSGNDFLCKHTQPTELASKKLDESSYVNTFDIMSDADRELDQSQNFQENVSDNMLSPVDSKCYLESSESDYHSTESDYISGPTICDNNQQTEKKRKMSETTLVSDNFGRTEKNLERSDKCDLRSKFISETIISENPLTSQDRKFSGETSNVSTVLICNDPSLAVRR